MNKVVLTYNEAVAFFSEVPEAKSGTDWVAVRQNGFVIDSLTDHFSVDLSVETAIKAVEDGDVDPDGFVFIRNNVLGFLLSNRPVGQIDMSKIEPPMVQIPQDPAQRKIKTDWK